jgi:hypothetical protein
MTLILTCTYNHSQSDSLGEEASPLPNGSKLKTFLS